MQNVDLRYAAAPAESSPRSPSFAMINPVINPVAGLDKRLTEMLKRWCEIGETLAVGRPEYKAAIEAADLGIACLCDDTVMDVWGLKNLMHCLVPEEETKLTEEDRLPMSKGLEMLLRRYNFDVKPEKMFQPFELSKIRDDAPLYEDLIIKRTISMVYEEMLVIREVRTAKLRLMSSLVKEAKEAIESKDRDDE